MSLYAKIALAVLVPVAILLAVDLVKLQDVIRGYEKTLESTYAVQSRAVRRNLDARIRELRGAARALATPREIVNAVQTADNEVLYDWSSGFAGAVDEVVFADTAGIVLARAPDEYRFGDRVDDQRFFQQTLSRRWFEGVVALDGRAALVAAMSIHQYEDRPVGVVCAAIYLTPAFLSSLVDDERVFLSFQAPRLAVDSGASDLQIVKSVSLGDVFGEAPERSNGMLTVSFGEDRNYRRLVDLKQVIYSTTVAMAAALCLLLTLILYRWLRPYAIIVGLILDYANGRSDLGGLHDRLTTFQRRSRHDAHKIAAALVQMLDLIKENLERAGAYNERLNRSVADLQAALAQVKTLSGLLPICAHCKKIRDDQGYWNQIEAYITAHSKAAFSHSICPECMKTHYGEFLDEAEDGDTDLVPAPGDRVPPVLRG